MFDRVSGYIHDHFKKDISLKTFASEFRVTLKTLRRSFLQTDADITPGKLILRLWMPLAVEMLKHTREKIARIAGECGYSDPFAFSRAFRSAMGISAHYRKQ